MMVVRGKGGVRDTSVERVFGIPVRAWGLKMQIINK